MIEYIRVFQPVVRQIQGLKPGQGTHGSEVEPSVLREPGLPLRPELQQHRADWMLPWTPTHPALCCMVSLRAGLAKEDRKPFVFILFGLT